MAEQEVDILIIGGGLTGATLMLALEGKGFRTLLVEAHPFASRTEPDFDARSLALSPASVRILQMLSLWPLLDSCATPIKAIHVSEQGRFGAALLQDDQAASGYVVEMQHISQAIHQRLDHANILVPAKLVALDGEAGIATVQQEKDERVINAKLIVAADGTHSTVRKLSGLSVTTKEYLQQALVANIGLARHHANCAYERFTCSGPLAMLPMKGHCASLVWSLEPDDAARFMAMSEQEFLKSLQKAFGYRLGRLNKVGKRFVYPLREMIMPTQTAFPLVFVGNAAHTLHPVAGQGFNLGLRDVATLAQCIVQHGLDAEMLKRYQEMRRYDQQSIACLTDSLARVFTSRIPGLGLIRGMGLITMEMIPGLQKVLTHHAGGFAGITPDLVCGLTLQKGA